MAAPGVPMMAFFVITLWMRQAKIQEIIAATQAAWIDMLDGSPEAGVGVKAQPPATDQALAHPEAIRIRERRVGGGNLIFLLRRHGLLLYLAAL